MHKRQTNLTNYVELSNKLTKTQNSAYRFIILLDGLNIQKNLGMW